MSPTDYKVYIYQYKDKVRVVKNTQVIFEGNEIKGSDLAILLHRHFNVGVKYDEVIEE